MKKRRMKDKAAAVRRLKRMRRRQQAQAQTIAAQNAANAGAAPAITPNLIKARSSLAKAISRNKALSAAAMVGAGVTGYGAYKYATAPNDLPANLGSPGIVKEAEQEHGFETLRQMTNKHQVYSEAMLGPFRGIWTDEEKLAKVVAAIRYIAHARPIDIMISCSKSFQDAAGIADMMAHESWQKGLIYHNDSGRTEVGPGSRQDSIMLNKVQRPQIEESAQKVIQESKTQDEVSSKKAEPKKDPKSDSKKPPAKTPTNPFQITTQLLTVEDEEESSDEEEYGFDDEDEYLYSDDDDSDGELGDDALDYAAAFDDESVYDDSDFDEEVSHTPQTPKTEIEVAHDTTKKPVKEEIPALPSDVAWSTYPTLNFGTVMKFGTAKNASSDAWFNGTNFKSGFLITEKDYPTGVFFSNMADSLLEHIKLNKPTAEHLYAFLAVCVYGMFCDNAANYEATGVPSTKEGLEEFPFNHIGGAWLFREFVTGLDNDIFTGKPISPAYGSNRAIDLFKDITGVPFVPAEYRKVWNKLLALDAAQLNERILNIKHLYGSHTTRWFMEWFPKGGA